MTALIKNFPFEVALDISLRRIGKAVVFQLKNDPYHRALLKR